MGIYANRGNNQQRTQYVTPEEKSSYMAMLGQRSGQAIEALGLLLDTPGAITRGILAGDPLSGFSFDRDSRVTGEELLDAYGLKPDNPYLSTPAGFAAEVALDPLAFTMLPLSAYSKAGSAAAKAGLTKYAPFIATLKKGSDATRTGKYTLREIGKAGLKPTTSVLQTRPLVGQRLAQMTTTLDEVVKAAPDPLQAFKDVQNALGNTPYAEVRNQRLGGVAGIWNPFSGESSVINAALNAGRTDDLSKLGFAEGAADALDRLGAGIRWSYPSRLASSFFSKAVGDTTKVGDQIMAMRRYQGQEQALRAGRSEATAHATRLQQIAIPASVTQKTGITSFFSPEGADTLLRLIEGKPIGTDLDLLRDMPELDDWIVGWRQIADSKLAEAKALGLKANELRDPFGTYFSPRSTPELDFTDGAVNAPGYAASYSAKIANQIARNPDLFVPGGTYQLQQISLDPRVRAFMKGASQETEAEIGAYIAQLIGNPLVTERQGTEIAKIYRALGKDIPDNIPVFGTHPIVEQMSYIINEEVRRNNAESAFEALVDSAVIARRENIPGGKYLRLSDALKQIGDAIGIDPNSRKASQYIRDRLAAAQFAPGTQARRIRLKSISVPREMVNRILRMDAFYNTPDAQKEVASLFDKFTTLFKSSVLTWPSRFARDAYSNLFSVWLETGDVAETLRGVRAGSKLINGKWDEIADYLESIPRYKALGLKGKNLIAQVQNDIGSTGTLQGLATSDLLSANRRGDISQFVPGSTPISISRALKQLVPDGSRNLSQQLSDFATVRGVNNTYETRNALYNASNMLGDSIDSMGRVGGFLALLRKGVSIDEASRRMKSALVDYGSLTKFERNFMRRTLFPWWAYTSRIGKYAVESLLRNPGGRYAQTIRAINDAQATTDETYIPTALRQRFAVRMPGWQDQLQTYLTDIDLPGIDTLNLIKLGYAPDMLGSALRTGQETIGEVFQQANPLIRSVAELATGRDFFSKRPLEQAVTPYDKIYRAATGNRYARINPLLRSVISNAASVVPMGSRGASLAANLVDPSIPDVNYRLLKALTNTFTGVKIQNVDAEYEALDALEKIRQQNAPYAQDFTISNIPKELLPTLPIETQRLDALGRDLSRQLREFYERKYAGSR